MRSEWLVVDILLSIHFLRQRTPKHTVLYLIQKVERSFERLWIDVGVQ